MLSKALAKHIRSLHLPKFRKEHGCFIVEGEKISLEWLQSAAPVTTIVCTKDWAEQHPAEIAAHQNAGLVLVKPSELESVSALKTANEVLLVATPFPEEDTVLKQEWHLALEGIRDPGNMGTIIRIADWFGIKRIICSPDCVDVYSPKVIQSAMGGHLRVRITETELVPLLRTADLPKLAATLNGKNAYKMDRKDAGILIIGNESNGLSQQVIDCATHQVTIPGRGGAESLNAGVSAGILCALLLPC